MKKYLPILTVMLLALVVFSGCSKKKVLVPVEGTLTLNGEAAEGVTLCFIPMDETVGVAAGATTDSSGHFTVTTGNDPGCALGDYKVTAYQLEITGESVTTIKSVNHFPKQYADPETSGLTATVSKNMEPLKFDLSK